MNITSIIIRKLTPENKMKAIVSITFDDAFVVHDVKVIDGANGLFIAMPSRRIQDGEFKDIVHPINSAFREELSQAVLHKYSEALQHYQETSAANERRIREDIEEETEKPRDTVEVTEPVTFEPDRTDLDGLSFVPAFSGHSIAETNA
jgi:stage V sporulation protein G